MVQVLIQAGADMERPDKVSQLARAPHHSAFILLNAYNAYLDIKIGR
jgi:hypothetical protein